MDRVSINVKREDVFKSRQKPAPIKHGELKNMFRVLCSSSILLNSYESSLNSLLSNSHDIEGVQREMATSICQTVTNLNDQIAKVKDAVADFMACRPETLETQTGFVREGFKAFSRYMDTFDYENLANATQYLGEDFNSKPVSIEQLQNSPHPCECTSASVIPQALDLLKGLLKQYENSSI